MDRIEIPKEIRGSELTEHLERFPKYLHQY